MHATIRMQCLLRLKRNPGWNVPSFTSEQMYVSMLYVLVNVKSLFWEVLLLHSCCEKERKKDVEDANVLLPERTEREREMHINEKCEIMKTSQSYSFTSTCTCEYVVLSAWLKPKVYGLDDYTTTNYKMENKTPEILNVYVPCSLWVLIPMSLKCHIFIEYAYIGLVSRLTQSLTVCMQSTRFWIVFYYQYLNVWC